MATAKEGARHFLLYWRPDTAKRECQLGRRMHHIASDQLGRVAPGDVVWIATIDGSNLYVLLRFVVGRIIDQHTAEGIFGRGLWEAKYHATLARGFSAKAQWVDVGSLARGLRFDSKTSLKLQVVSGKINPQQLQTMRVLTPESAASLDELWGANAGTSLPAQSPTPDWGGGFSTNYDENTQIETAAMRLAAAHYRARGWNVKQTIHDGVGHDLLCRRKREELRVEVKGIKGSVPEFLMYYTEWNLAQEDSPFEVFVVTNALSRTPTTTILTRSEFLRQYIPVPVTYKMRLRS